MEGLGRYGGCLLIHWVDAELDDGADVFGRGPVGFAQMAVFRRRRPARHPTVSEPGDAVGRRYPQADFRPGRMTPDQAPVDLTVPHQGCGEHARSDPRCTGCGIP